MAQNVVLLPTIMWLASGMPDMAVHIGALRASMTGLLMLGGLTLSVWTIVYMKRRGKGNPMDAFGHEVAPRTQHLMTDGPYRINRNPMLTGRGVHCLAMDMAGSIGVGYFLRYHVRASADRRETSPP